MWALLSCALITSCASVDTAEPSIEPSVVTSVRAEDSEPDSAPSPTVSSVPHVDRGNAVRLVFVGDVMLGRNVAPVVSADPSSVFERLRPILVDADLAFGNLESPLTERPHLSGEFALEADPAAAALLAGAGFDVLGIANNHATDAGLDTVLDTLAALETAGLRGVGGGADNAEAATPVIIDVDGVRVGTIAFDLSGGQPATAATAGVNAWDRDLARDTIADLEQSVDVTVVGLHGGVEYLTRPDPVLDHIVGLVADWGADVVWGHGAHVGYPAEARTGSLGKAVVAPGLGNALFDQRLPGTQVGAVLEVLVDRDGVIAMRSGQLAIDAGRSSFEGWDEPTGDAASLDGDWWTPVRPWSAAVTGAVLPVAELAIPPEHLEVARAHGDVTGTGETDLVVAYRRPLRAQPVHDLFPQIDWSDDHGRSAHIAVFTDTGRMRWGSAVMFEPVGRIAVCDGAMALGFTAIDGSAVISGGAWLWDGFGFRTAPVLPGIAVPTCADIDHDGHADPVLTGRAPSTTTRFDISTD